MMARRPMHPNRNPAHGLDAGAVLEAVLPYAAALLFLLALLVAALDERGCDGTDAQASTLAPVMSRASALPHSYEIGRDTRFPNSSAFGFEHPLAAANCSGSSKPERSE